MRLPTRGKWDESLIVLGIGAIAAGWPGDHEGLAGLIGLSPSASSVAFSAPHSRRHRPTIGGGIIAATIQHSA
jgi:hypothetical protein